MNQLMTKLLFLILFFCVVKAENQACDKVLDSMVNSCKAIRSTLISTDSLDPKVACCNNARYDLCVQGVKAYVTVTRSTRICQESNYEEKLQSLESNPAMQVVKKLCESFDAKSCITDTMSSAWGSIAETFNPSNFSKSISKNFNEAMSSIGNFVKNIGSQTQEGTTSMTNKLRRLLPQQGVNYYNLVPEQEKPASDNSLSFSKFFNSFTSLIEVIPKKDDEKE